MPIRKKHITLAGKIVLDTLMLAFVLSLTALPASTFSLLRYEENPTVLSAQDERYQFETLKLQEIADDENEEEDEEITSTRIFQDQ